MKVIMTIIQEGKLQAGCPFQGNSKNFLRPSAKLKNQHFKVKFQELGTYNKLAQLDCVPNFFLKNHSNLIGKTEHMQTLETGNRKAARIVHCTVQYVSCQEQTGSDDGHVGQQEDVQVERTRCGQTGRDVGRQKDKKTGRVKGEGRQEEMVADRKK